MLGNCFSEMESSELAEKRRSPQSLTVQELILAVLHDKIKQIFDLLMRAGTAFLQCMRRSVRKKNRVASSYLRGSDMA